jgi:hypothetical protein
VTQTKNDDIDAMMDGPAAESWAAEEALAATVPTTMAGLLALLAYAGELVSYDPGPILLSDETGPIFVSSLAKAARSLRDQVA